MKKLLIICLVVFSCSSESNDDDNNQQDITPLIVGEWSFERYVLEENGVITIDLVKNECSEQNVWIFNANDNFTKISYVGISLEDCSNNSIINGTYTLIGNVLSMSEFEDDRIIEITSNTLVMKDPVCDNNECDGLNFWYYNRVN